MLHFYLSPFKIIDYGFEYISLNRILDEIALSYIIILMIMMILTFLNNIRFNLFKTYCLVFSFSFSNTNYITNVLLMTNLYQNSHFPLINQRIFQINTHLRYLTLGIQIEFYLFCSFQILNFHQTSQQSHYYFKAWATPCFSCLKIYIVRKPFSEAISFIKQFCH